MEPGRVVELIESKRFLTGLITKVRGTKLVVLTESDREMGMSSGRLINAAGPLADVSRPRIELVRFLRNISLKRTALAEKVDLIELWDLLEGEGETFSYEYLAELALPIPTGSDEIVALIRAVYSNGLHFKMRPQEAVRHSAELVEQIAQDRIRRTELECEMDEAGKWLASVWADETPDDPDCREHVVSVLQDMALFGQEANEYKWGQRLLDRARVGQAPGAPFRLLVKIGEMNKHENLELLRHGVETAFPEHLQDQARIHIRNADWIGERRQDLTDMEAITIDNSHAGDFDDAISLEETDNGFVLGVHIADVSGLITAGSPLDVWAGNQGTSIYMPDQRIPMLPEVLSEEGLSLRKNEVRPAFSLRVQIKEDGEIGKFEFFPSMIKVKRQLSYQEADGLIDSDPLLKKLFFLSRTLQNRRQANGALIMPLPSLNVYITAEGMVEVGLISWDQPARSTITELMVLANHLAARFLKESGAPGIYRFQEEPSKRLIESDAKTIDLYKALKQRRYLNRVGWSLEPKPHNGMGLEVYTNLTSPLRRYIDLMMQRQIRCVSLGQPPCYSNEEMSDQLTAVEIALRKAYRIQTRRKRYWLLTYLEVQAPRRQYEAIVLDRLPGRWRLFVKEFMLDTDLVRSYHKELEPGQEVLVRIKKVNALEDTLRFELV
jgi:exoribonuclease-2